MGKGFKLRARGRGILALGMVAGLVLSIRAMGAWRVFNKKRASQGVARFVSSVGICGVFWAFAMFQAAGLLLPPLQEMSVFLFWIVGVALEMFFRVLAKNALGGVWWWAIESASSVGHWHNWEIGQEMKIRIWRRRQEEAHLELALKPASKKAQTRKWI